VADIVHLNDWACFTPRDRPPLWRSVVMHARTVADRDHWALVLAKRLLKKYVARVVAIDESVRLSLQGLVPCEVIYNPLDTTTRGSRGRRPTCIGA